MKPSNRDQIMFNVVLEKNELESPIDPLGRDVRWFELLAEGDIYYENALFSSPLIYLRHLKAQFDLLTIRGYKIPVLVEHKRNGERQGDVLEVQIINRNNQIVLVAALAINDLNSKIENGIIKYVSVGIGDVSLDTGDVLKSVINEVSIVAAPHRKNSATHVILNENGGGMDLEQMAALLAELNEKCQKLEERMVVLETPKEMEEVVEDPKVEEEEIKAEEVAVEDEEKEEEVVEVALSEKVKALELALKNEKLNTFKASYPSIVQFGETAIESLYELSNKDKVAFEKIVKGSKNHTNNLRAIGSNLNFGEVPKDPAQAWEFVKNKHNGDLAKANAEWAQIRNKFSK